MSRLNVLDDYLELQRYARQSFSGVFNSDSLEVTDTSKTILTSVKSISNQRLRRRGLYDGTVVINCEGTQNMVTECVHLDTSFVDKTIAQKLWGGYSTSLTISTATNQSKTVKVNEYNNVSTHKNLIILELFTREHIPNNKSHIPTKETAMQWDHFRTIFSLKDYPVILLIGYNCWEALIP